MMLRIRVKELFNHLKRIGIESYQVAGSFDKEAWQLFLNTEIFPHRAISWKEFKSLESDETKKEYIQYVCEEFGITNAEPLTKIFGVSYYTLHSYLKNHNLFSFDKSSKKQMSKSNIDRLNDFIGLNSYKTEVIEKDEDISDVSVVVPEEKTIEKEIPSYLEMEFSGGIFIDNITETLKAVLGEKKRGTIKITIDNRKD